jgi:hypothetical protein
MCVGLFSGSMFASRAVANRKCASALLSPRIPAATRAEHRDAVLAYLMVEVRDCTTRTWTSLSGRSVQDASEHGVCSTFFWSMLFWGMLFREWTRAEKRQREAIRDANQRARF